MPIQYTVDVVSQRTIYCFVNSFVNFFEQMAEITLMSLDYHSRWKLDLSLPIKSKVESAHSLSTLEHIQYNICF